MPDFSLFSPKWHEKNLSCPGCKIAEGCNVFSIEDLPQFQRSWEAIIEMSPCLLYPAHGKPFPTAVLKKYLKTLDKVRLRALK